MILAFIDGNKVYLHYEELEINICHPFYNGSGLFILRGTKKM
jgi:fido (protein-threonine AMPylation protein)